MEKVLGNKYRKLPETSFLKQMFSYNPATGLLTRNEKTSRSTLKGEVLGSLTNKGYLTVGILGKNYMLHRVVWKMYYGTDPKDQIDHINGIKNDNRIENLRDVTNQENHRNVKRIKVNKTGFTGVCWHKYAYKYRAYISKNGKQINLGLYDTIEEAAHQRMLAEKLYNFHENHGR